jgi:ATP phosphoribosyltransferase regulatory subunit
MTPQVARIEAHYLKRNGPVRLCYLGPVLRTRPGAFGEPREPLQLGAELFGHEGPESDAEIIELLVEVLAAAGVNAPHLAMGHVGVYRALVREIALPEELEAKYFDALLRKSRPDINALAAASSLDEQSKAMLTGLIDLQGDPVALDRARALLAPAGPAVMASLDNLAAVVQKVTARLPELPLYVDLAELRGYGYHTGVVFSAYAPGQGQAVAHGGRYDAIGRAFGEARPATGFSADLRSLLRLNGSATANRKAILAPADEDPLLDAKLRQLRAAGERVLRELPGLSQTDPEQVCDRRVIKDAKGWTVVKL